jgi:hypothetical protein
MAVYVVSYDLKLGSGTHDYKDLYAALAKFDSVKILYSVYLLSSTSSAATLRDHLRKFMDPKDRLWVSRVTGDHSGFIMDEGVKWLNTHPTG